MKRYRLLVRQGNKLLGHFDSSVPLGLEAVQEISCILSGAGYQLERLMSDSERRLLESGLDGIRTLSSEPIFRPDDK